MFSSSEDLHISEADSLSEEERVIKMLDEAIEDSSGYSSGSDQVSNWSDEDSITDTDGYETVYTRSGSEYSDDSGDECGTPLPPLQEEEKLVELDKLAEVSNIEQVEAENATDVLEVADTTLNQDDTKEVSIVGVSKDIKDELQVESSTASVLEILDGNPP